MKTKQFQSIVSEKPDFKDKPCVAFCSLAFFVINNRREKRPETAELGGVYMIPDRVSFRYDFIPVPY